MRQRGFRLPVVRETIKNGGTLAELRVILHHSLWIVRFIAARFGVEFAVGNNETLATRDARHIDVIQRDANGRILEIKLQGWMQRESLVLGVPEVIITILIGADHAV